MRRLSGGVWFIWFFISYVLLWLFVGNAHPDVTVVIAAMCASVIWLIQKITRL